MLGDSLADVVGWWMLRREAVSTVREVVLANLPEGDEGGLKRVGLGI